MKYVLLLLVTAVFRGIFRRKTLAMLLITLTASAACAPDREVVEIYKGDPGLPGQDGASGQSCYVEASEEGGAYLTCGETTVFISNGLQGIQGPAGEAGPQGPVGPQGPAGEDGDDRSVTLYNYSGSSCTQILTTGKYVKLNGSNYRLYSSSSCHSSSAFAEVSQGEAYWVSPTVLATHANSTLRVIQF